MKTYPFSYFAYLFSAKKLFAQRKKLTIWQKVFTTIFLISLLVVPVSLQVSSLSSYPLENIVPAAYHPLSNEVLDHLQTATLQDNNLNVTEKSFPSVTFGNQKQSNNGVNFHFSPQQLVIQQDSIVITEIEYKQFEQTDFHSKKQLAKKISEIWFQKHRFEISLFLISSASLIISLNILLLLLGASLILFFVSFTRFVDIKGFSQSYSLVLYCLGLPTMIAFLVGLSNQSVSAIITVQNMLFILQLLWVFYKTRFQNQE